MTKLVLACALLFAACHHGGATGGDSTPPPAATKTLYERLGGKPAITAVVDDFVKRTSSDPRIEHFFVNIDVPNIKSKMVDQICAGTGGPCTYTGKSMKDAHATMGVHDADFTAFIEDLTATLDQAKVPAEEKKEVLAIFESMKGDVVTNAPAAAK